MADTCAGCKYWNKADRGPRASTGHAETFQIIDVPGEWGTCERIIRLSDDSHQVPPHMDLYGVDDPNVLAYLADGSGYFASLTTRSDFGCTLWEQR